MYKYCLKCLNSLNDDGICSSCGFDNYSYNREIHHIKPETLLHERYYVGAELGEGGFGITYVGLDIVLNRKIAIKEFFPNGGVWRSDDGVTVNCHTALMNQQNFELGKQKSISEAQSLAKLDDISSVVRILDYFSENNTAYIIMEFVEGSTLKDYVRNLSEKLTLQQVLDMLKPVVDALSLIHKRGFVHRDISPDNIMLASSGTCKLLDFGAVKSVNFGGSATEHPVIKQGFSPLEMYSSNGLIGPWTDVYALASTILYLVIGIYPDDPPDRMDNDTLPEKLNKELSPQQVGVFLKALEIQSKNRYQTVNEFISDLQNSLPKENISNNMPQDLVIVSNDDGNEPGNQSIQNYNSNQSVMQLFKQVPFKKNLKLVLIALLSLICVTLFVYSVKEMLTSQPKLTEQELYLQENYVNAVNGLIELNDYCLAYETASDAYEKIPNSKSLKKLVKKLEKEETQEDKGSVTASVPTDDEIKKAFNDFYNLYEKWFLNSLVKVKHKSESFTECTSNSDVLYAHKITESGYYVKKQLDNVFLDYCTEFFYDKMRPQLGEYRDVDGIFCYCTVDGEAKSVPIFDELSVEIVKESDDEFIVKFQTFDNEIERNIIKNTIKYKKTQSGYKFSDLSNTPAECAFNKDEIYTVVAETEKVEMKDSPHKAGTAIATLDVGTQVRIISGNKTWIYVEVIELDESTNTNGTDVKEKDDNESQAKRGYVSVTNLEVYQDTTGKTKSSKYYGNNVVNAAKKSIRKVKNAARNIIGSVF